MSLQKNITNKLIKMLSNKGWENENFLLDQSYSIRGNYQSFDLILLYNFFPLAVFEIKNTANLLDGESYLSQVGDIDIPFYYFYNLNGLFLLSGKYLLPVKEEDFPSPLEMWNSFCNQSIETDPRIYPTSEKIVHNFNEPQIQQVFAVRNAIQAVIDGERRSMISMPKGSGVPQVVFTIEWKLIKSGYLKRILHIVEDESQKNFLLKKYPDFYEATTFNNEVSEGKVLVITTAQVIRDKIGAYDRLKTEFFDLVILDSLQLHDYEDAINNIFRDSPLLAINLRFLEKERMGWAPAYIFTIEDVATLELPRPPKGYKSIKLEEISEVRRGVMVDRVSDETEGGTFHVLTSRSISSDGYLDLSSKTTASFAKQEIFDPTGKLLRPEYYIKPGDILIADTPFSISEGLRCAVVPDEIENNLIFSSSIICIRITDKKTNPNNLYEFFRSGTGASIVRRFAASMGSAIARIKPATLEKIPVFIPSMEKPTPDQGVDFSSVKKQLAEIISLLNKLEESRFPEDVSDEEDKESQISLIAEKIKNVYPILVPLKLHERVMSQYPMPIALVYRRFYDARFNTYEQVLRLRDVYEATCFYVYNILLADYLNRLDMTKYIISDKGARKAYDDFSMAGRLKFIEKILEISRLDSGKDLFIPEFTKCSFVKHANKLRSDFRNSLSHTATATESQQRKILGDYKDIVDTMLKELVFLTNYRLVRIPSFHFMQHKLVRRMEVYHGVSPELDENPIEHIELITADRDHIVLLDAENKFLDLFPLYQLIAYEETRYETHMCFLKERKGSERRLRGESVQGAFEVDLGGVSDFDTLIAKIPENKK